MEIKIIKTTTPRPKPADPTKLGFGTVFTDHMFIMDYDREHGWHDARIVPLENLSIHPGAAARAEKDGFDQVLWLDGVHRKYIEEVGSMNVMFKINGKVITPMLSGSVLSGITRRSCIQILRDKGIEVEERLISVDEIMDALESGVLEEAWGCGTAAVISPIGCFAYKGKAAAINNQKIGPCFQELYDTLTGIQWGRKADPYGWVVKIPKTDQ